MASAAERPTRRAALALALALLLTLCGAAPRPIALPLPLGYDPRLHTSTRIALADDEINFSCGAMHSQGRFAPDPYGWMLPATAANTDRDEFTNDAVEFQGAEPKNLIMLRTQRYGKNAFAGKWGYKVPVRNPGVFGCTVHFAELSDVVERPNAKRLFNLDITAAQGSKSWKNLNVYNSTGKFSSFVKTAEGLVVSRYLEFTVQKAAGSDEGAIMSGVTCERTGNLPAGVKPVAPPGDAEEPIRNVPIGSVTPAGPAINTTSVNINCGGAAVGMFLADEPEWHHHYGPSTVFSVAKTQPIGMGTRDASKEQALRDSVYGIGNSNFGYQISLTQSGMWECHLHFAEIDPAKKVGDRVFDLQVQNLKLDNFDIKAKTGGAPFTAYVQTFPVVPVTDYLLVRLWAQKGKGDPSINAIMCELKTPKSKEDMQKLLAASETIVKPSPDPTQVSPFDAALVSEFTRDANLTVAEGRELSSLVLGLNVPAKTDINDALKAELKKVIAKYSKAGEGNVAITGFKQIAEAKAVTVRVLTTDPKSSFQVDAQFSVADGTGDTARKDVVSAISSGQGTKDLVAAGYPGSELVMLGPSVKIQTGATPATSGAATSTIVAAVVGSCLVALLLVAVVVFFVVQRHRRNEMNPAAFDAPPPEMEDSDGSASHSSSEHSESQNSVDYLDDDSTFTAATSHQADPEAGVTLDKDVWGRGSS